VPVSHTLDSGILRITATGAYQPQDIPREFLAGLADPACPTPVGILLDVTGSAELSHRTPQQIRFVAEFLKPYAERIGRRCAVAIGSEVQYGLGRMGAVFAESVGVEVQIFPTADEAQAWLRRTLASAPGRKP
jgi:hypothetical protein